MVEEEKEATTATTTDCCSTTFIYLKVITRPMSEESSSFVCSIKQTKEPESERVIEREQERAPFVKRSFRLPLRLPSVKRK